MAFLEDMTGKLVGKIKVIKRARDYDGLSDLRVQWVIECLKCDERQIVVARDLKRYKMRFEKGCYACSNTNKRPSYKFKYGRNINGFIDKSIIIPL